MKIVIAKAMVTAVTPIAENHGNGANKELVDGVVLTLVGQLPPDALDELSKRLKPFLFDKDIPGIPELGEIEWTPEYENAAFTIHGLRFQGAELKGIRVAAIPGYLIDFKCKVKVMQPGDELGGKLNALLRREVKVRLEKMTQKVLDPDEGTEGDDKQQGLDDGSGAFTSDKKPIKPLMDPVTTKH